MENINDVEEIRKMYFERDNEMNLNPKNVMIDGLIKLGYCHNDGLDEKMKKEYKLYILKELAKQNIINLLQFNEFAEKNMDRIINKINYENERFQKLNYFVSNNNLIDFYNELNMEELIILGY